MFRTRLPICDFEGILVRSNGDPTGQTRREAGAQSHGSTGCKARGRPSCRRSCNPERHHPRGTVGVTAPPRGTRVGALRRQAGTRSLTARSSGNPATEPHPCPGSTTSHPERRRRHARRAEGTSRHTSLTPAPLRSRHSHGRVDRGQRRGPEGGDPAASISWGRGRVAARKEARQRREIGDSPAVDRDVPSCGPWPRQSRRGMPGLRARYALLGRKCEGLKPRFGPSLFFSRASRPR